MFGPANREHARAGEILATAHLGFTLLTRAVNDRFAGEVALRVASCGCRGEQTLDG